MRDSQKTYVSPVLETKGDVATATRASMKGDFEPGTLIPRENVGDVGFGL